MKKVTAIGEALIDFIPEKTGCRLQDVPGFRRACGGAPANAAAAAARIGAQASMITMLGEDAFGDYIVNVLQNAQVDTTHILRTDLANTALAFVSLQEDGTREFSFYRKPSADMLLDAPDITEAMLEQTGILHFCSVALPTDSMQRAHRKAVALVRKNNGIISFDPNIRLPLWDDPKYCQQVVRQFLPLADIVKISDEEAEFVTGFSDIESVSDVLFSFGVSVVLFSQGKEGATIRTKHFSLHQPSPAVRAIDTTGAGDALIGCLLGLLARQNADRTSMEAMDQEAWAPLLKTAVAFSSYSVTQHGAIDSYPTEEACIRLIKEGL